MRALMPVMLVVASTSIARADTPSLTVGKPAVRGKVDAKAITATLEANHALLLACAAAGPGGEVVATFSIAGTGGVVGADAPGLTTPQSTCMAGVLATLTFARPTDGRPSAVSVRLRFATGTRATGGLAPRGSDDHAHVDRGLGATGSGHAPANATSVPGAGYRRVPVRSSSARLGTPKIRGLDVDAVKVRRYVKRYLTRLGGCYEKALLATPSIAGTLIADFTIGADGKVSTATAKGVHAHVETCVANAIRAIAFPKPRTPTDVTVSFPITFTP